MNAGTMPDLIGVRVLSSAANFPNFPASTRFDILSLPATFLQPRILNAERELHIPRRSRPRAHKAAASGVCALAVVSRGVLCHRAVASRLAGLRLLVADRRTDRTRRLGNRGRLRIKYRPPLR